MADRPGGAGSAGPAGLASSLLGPGVLPAYLHLVRGQARAQASYRASFVIEVLTAASGTVLDVLSVLVLFRATRTLGGFDVTEALVVVGLSASGFALADTAVGNVDRIGLYVRLGLLDAVLVRPLPVLPQLVLGDLALRKLSRAAVGVAVLAAALAHAGVDWTPARAALVVVTPLAGAVFFGSIFVASSSVAFWWTDSGELGKAFTYGGRDLTAYPMTVYGGWFRNVFSYALGFGFVAYYPALAILGRADPLGLPSWAGWASPAAAVVAAAAAGALWRVGVRHYRSTGS